MVASSGSCASWRIRAWTDWRSRSGGSSCTAILRHSSPDDPTNLLGGPGNLRRLLKEWPYHASGGNHFLRDVDQNC
jgi:hypothetical protein